MYNICSKLYTHAVTVLHSGNFNTMSIQSCCNPGATDAFLPFFRDQCLASPTNNCQNFDTSNRQLSTHTDTSQEHHLEEEIICTASLEDGQACNAKSALDPEQIRQETSQESLKASQTSGEQTSSESDADSPASNAGNASCSGRQTMDSTEDETLSDGSEDAAANGRRQLSSGCSSSLGQPAAREDSGASSADLISPSIEVISPR